METDRLRYFCLIAETGSLTKAAEILNISHSGLSKAMSVLQDELGQVLFRPQGRGLELTPQGKELYLRSKQVLELVENLKGPTKATEAKVLRIGLTEIFSMAFGGELAGLFSQGLELHELDSGEIEFKLLENQIDFAISTVPFPHPQIEYLKVAKAAMGVFCINPKFEKKTVDEIPFVGPNSDIKNNPLSIRARDGWPEGHKRQLAFGASSLAVAMDIVDSGQAAVFIPKFIAAALNGKRKADFFLRECEHGPKVPARDVFVVKKKNAEESKEMKSVARLLRKQC
jgi:DNA-binding transcriptional LysR family regulator